MSVAIVGSTVRDVVYLPGRAPVHSPGGSPLFAARALAALGVRPGVATRCDDAALAAPIAELAAPLCLRLDATRHDERAALPPRRRARPRAGRASARPGARTTSRGWAAPALRGRDLGARRHAARRRPGPAGAGGAGRPAGAASRSTRRARCACRSSGRSCSAAPSTPRCCGTCRRSSWARRRRWRPSGRPTPRAIRAQCGVPEVLVTFGFRGAAVACEGGSGHVAAAGRDRHRPDRRGRRLPGRLRARARARARRRWRRRARACEHVSALFAARARA